MIRLPIRFLPVFHLGRRRLRLFLIPLSEARSECERGHEQQDTPENDAKDAIIHRDQTDRFGAWFPAPSSIP
jgi:hypothetical protein